MKYVFHFISVLFFCLLVFSPLKNIYAQSCDSSCANTIECQQKIAKCQEAWDQMEAAKKPHVDTLRKMEADIAAFLNRIKIIEAEMVKKAAAIIEGEKELGSLLVVANRRIRSFYMRSSNTNLIAVLLSSSDVGTALRSYGYQQAVTNEDKRVITQTAVMVKDLENKKKKLEGERITLASMKEDVDRRAISVRKLVGDANAYQSKLSTTIASLTALQVAILNAKTGTFQTSVGDVPLADDAASRPDYNPGFSPAFAAFSFGAPHYRGMSQYGAFGRAKQDQNYETILRAYYGGGIEIRDHNPDAQISVDGYGTYSLEEYAKRIYEMPGSWGDEGGMEALKAQAIAARSYALARGGSICATESCQVFKPEPKGGNWEKAVNDTRGKVVYANGSPFSTWYASTSGGYQESYSANGYSTPGFWDTQNGRAGWTSQAYEKIGGSPWFYKAWYKNRAGDSCGRSHPWLTSEEMADILNAWVVLYQGGGDSSRVTPTSSCWGGNPYSMSELRSIGGYTNVSGVSVTYSEAGVTSTVTFQTNKGSVPITGADFKKAFNLRAPGRVSLMSGLFNIERK
ncbi:MAG: SpoIID/LytB domain-containing protein [Candidatus Gottesmanbacteria bacterium]